MEDKITSSTFDFVELTAQIIDGDKHAENRLVDRFYKGTVFLLLRQTDDIGLSEDIAHDTFITVLENIRQGKLQQPKALASYIRKTAINQLIAYRRKSVRRDTHPYATTDLYTSIDTLCISEALHNKKLVHCCMQLINEMKTERDRNILRQFFVYQFTKQQICEDFNLSPEHFDRVLYRARIRLRQMLIHKLTPSSTESSATLSSRLFVAILVMFLITRVENVMRDTGYTYHLKSNLYRVEFYE